MNYTQDTTFLMMIFILPSLFGLSLIGEGVSKIMNYDPRGWVGIIAGGGFIIVIILAYFLLSSNALAAI
jgi:hypothetical protein